MARRRLLSDEQLAPFWERRPALDRTHQPGVLRLSEQNQ
jgi:hypothetical protein